MKIKHILSILLITLLFMSCGTLKNKTKSVDKFEVKESAEVSKREEVKKDVQIKDKEVDRDINTEVVEETTKKTTKGTNTSTVVGKDDFNEDGVARIKDEEGRLLIIKLDSLKRALEITYESPEVVEEKTTKTTRQVDRTKERERDSTDRTESKEAIVVREEYEEESKETDTKTQANFLAIIALCIGVAGGVLLLIWGIRKIVLKK